ncbi:redoxin domain-containing protein [Flavitalea flava]
MKRICYLLCLVIPVLVFGQSSGQSSGQMACAPPPRIGSLTGQLAGLQPANRSIPSPSSLTLSDLHHKKTSPRLTGEQQYYVFVFLSPECPLCQNYTTLLNKLFDRYDGQIAFYGIIPGKSYTAEVVEKFRTDYSVKFDLLFDPAFLLTRMVKATTTPEVFLISKKNEIIYSGLIDNWAASLGVKRTVVTEHYLAEGIDSSLRHLSLKTKMTRPVGCLINNY